MAQNPPLAASTKPNPRKPYVRIVTDKRREQNRRAQKAYRDRLKKKLGDLEEQAAGVVHVSRTDDADSDLDSGLGEVSPTADMHGRGESDGDGNSSSRGEYARLVSPPRTEGRSQLDSPYGRSAFNAKVINLADAFAAAGDLPFGHGSLPGIPFQVAPPTPEPERDEHVGSHIHEDYGDIDMRTIWPLPARRQRVLLPDPSRGSKFPLTFTPRRTPTGSSSSSRSPIADPYVNHMRLVAEGYIEASIAIGLALRISRSSYVNDHPSHFPSCYVSLNKPDPRSPTNSISSNTVAYKIADRFMQITPELHDHLEEVKQPLRPTPAQLLHPHPVYLDCIVFPHFRELAVKASADGILDHPQLFMDLMHGGLVCWGGMSGLSNRHGRSTKSGKRDMRDNVAWSTRSWEAQKWFLKKWTWLIGTEEEEEARGDFDGIWRGSRWWSSMRGEEESDEEDDEQSITSARVSEVEAGGHCL